MNQEDVSELETVKQMRPDEDFEEGISHEQTISQEADEAGAHLIYSLTIIKYIIWKRKKVHEGRIEGGNSDFFNVLWPIFANERANAIYMPNGRKQSSKIEFWFRKLFV